MCDYEISNVPLAAMSATKIFVSARMTSLPGLAKTILADSDPKKNFPIKVPLLFHTCSQLNNERMACGHREGLACTPSPHAEYTLPLEST